ncbi:hypothetical protein MASR2M66_00520 [Chloroflexota bacterium]
MRSINDRWLLFASLALVTASVTVRVLAFPYSNQDLDTFNLIWYQTILSQGAASALGTTFTNYSPPYSYLLVLASLLHPIFEPLTVLKLIPTLFDIFTAGLVYKIVRLKFKQRHLPILALALYFAAPTIVLNSALWGQVDSIYSYFLLASIYFLLTERQTPAWIALGISFAVKAQAIFLAPLFLILLLQKRLSWKGILWMPVAYILAVLPTILLGRSVWDVFTIYLSQSKTYGTLARNAPNFYSFLPQAWYSSALWIGLIIAAVTLLAWVFHSRTDASASSNRERLILLTLLSLALTPFLLPKMHDRYFYPADVLSILLIFFYPQLWFVPIMTQAVSLLSYSVFLFNGSHSLVWVAALINTITLAVLLKEQERGIQVHSPFPARVASILLTVSLPLILFGAGLRFAFTPLFMRVDYQISRLEDSIKLTQFERDGHALEYVTTGRADNFLNQLKDEQGRMLLIPEEQNTLGRLQATAKNIFSIWHVSLLMFLTACLLFWVYSDASQWHNVLVNGGKAAVWSAPLGGLALFFGSNAYNLRSESLLRVFTSNYWLTASLWVFGFTLLTGLIITNLRSTKKE